MAQALSREGIGASEIAAALGLNPYKDPITLWREKVGELAPFSGSEASDWGMDVEPSLRQWYVRTCGLAVLIPETSLFHPTETWARATPDGMALTVPDRPADRGTWDHLFEAKNANWRQAHRWGEPGTDEVPVEYLLQVQQNLAVTDLPWGAIVASIGGAPPAIYRIERDEELLAMMFEGGRAFWRTVQERTPPPVDATEGYAQFLAERHPFSRDEMVIADPLAEAAAARLCSIRADLAELKRAKVEQENVLKAAIGGAAGIETTVGRITWKPSRPSRTIDWEAVARNIAWRTHMDDGYLAELAQAHVKEGEATRPFVVPRAWSKS